MDHLSNCQISPQFTTVGVLKRAKGQLGFFALLLFWLGLFLTIPNFGFSQSQGSGDELPTINLKEAGRALKSNQVNARMGGGSPLSARTLEFESFCSSQADLQFSNGVRIPGSAANLTVGASYRFPNVVIGGIPTSSGVGVIQVDAIVTIEQLVNGTLADIDGNSGASQGYNEALQPIFTTRGGSNNAGLGYATFNIEFVVSGTTTPITIPSFAGYLIDIDGDPQQREFQSISSNLNVSFGAGAASRIAEITSNNPAPFNIRYQNSDGQNRTAGGNNLPRDLYANMMQVEFVGISSFKWRIGVENLVSAGSESRYFSLYVSCLPDFTVDNLDFSDAPATYGAPSHVRGNSLPRFGATVDTEAGPFPATFGNQANGDDNNQSPDDEDGVTFPSTFAAGSNATVTLTTTSSGDAKVNGWIDWNGDGDFLDEGEKVVVNRNVNGTGVSTNISIPVPCDAKAGFTYMRFRINTAGGLESNGSSLNGEVEDYRIQITSNFTPITFSDQPDPAIYCVGQTPVAPLSVTAAGSGTLTYQWYVNTQNNTTTGTLINGATSSSYTPPVTEAVLGDRYYYVIVTGNCKPATSNTAKITVNAVPAAPSLTEVQPTCSVPTGSISFTAAANVQYSLTSDFANLLTPSNGVITISELAANSSGTVFARTTGTNCSSSAPYSIGSTLDAPATPEGLSFVVVRNTGNYNFKANKSNQGNSLRWYNSLGDQNPLPGTPEITSANLGEFTKYVSEVNENGCESPRVAAAIIVQEDFPPCEPVDFNCSTNNLNFPAVYLSDANGNRITGTCEDGVQQDVFITVQIQQNSNAARYNTRLFAKLYIGEDPTPIQVNSFLGLIDVGDGNVVTRVIQQVDGWTCGDELRLENILVVWLTNANSTPQVCNDYNPAQSECLPEIFVSAPLSADIEYTSCFGDTGSTFSFNADVNGGVPSYTYKWDFDNNGVFDLEGNNANPVHTYADQSATQIRLVVVDSQNPAVSVTRIENILYPTPFDVSIELVQPTCDVAKGKITVGVVNGATYSIVPNVFQASNVFNEVDPGVYTVTVKTADGCLRTTTASINAQPQTPEAPMLTV
ncbi:PKD domain-containing protein, partial [Algoriphagus litoralis]|uniref:PKD domain-containing protein n=1 Tax=Algoriphagus litoralis TaxID=2202829 RepID=UPI0018E57D58